MTATTNEYSAADFARARFAEKRALYTACRSKSGFWRTESGCTLSDEEMAENEWIPILAPAADPKPTPLWVVKRDPNFGQYMVVRQGTNVAVGVLFSTEEKAQARADIMNHGRNA